MSFPLRLPYLKIIYIYYLDSGSSINISKFPDYTTIGIQISSDREAVALQDELSRRDELAVKWQMDFNINMCSTLHIGRHNTSNTYILFDVDIGKSKSGKKT